MPIQYKDGIIAEHNLTREKSGIFDVSHMGQLFIMGDDKLTDKLQDIFPTDLKNLLVNQSKYSFLMNDSAGIHDDLIITKIMYPKKERLNLQKALNSNSLITKNLLEIILT